MKLNAWFAIAFLAVFASLLFIQVKSVAALNGQSPITAPITSPVSPTPTPTASLIVTPSPVVTPTPKPEPVKEYVLSGRVEYIKTVYIFRKQYQIKVPAVGVHVIAINDLKPFAYQDDTDLFGNFKFKLASSEYSVTAYDGAGFHFEPRFTIVQLNKNIKNLYFQGQH